MDLEFPVYIVSKGRHDSSLTSKALSAMRVAHFVVVEPQEVQPYERALRGSLATVIPLDMSYKSKYETCDGLGQSKSTGPGPARNFAWDHSISGGHYAHWVMDDNISMFHRLHRNERIRCSSPLPFVAMNEFFLRHSNIAMCGPNYTMFAVTSKMSRLPPFITNTRIYSCNLIRNDIPFRWRGRYNEDTILSLDVLKAGWCTVQFNAFLQNKLRTQTIGGGNTAEFYAKEGTGPKSSMQVAVHPDCSRIVHKFGRVHHHVDYKRFRQSLIRRADRHAVSIREPEMVKK